MPKGIDGLPGRQHDLVFAARMIRDKLGDVVDTILKETQRAKLERGD